MVSQHTRNLVTNKQGVFHGARNHTYGFVVSAAMLLGMASLALMLAAFMGWGEIAVLGQVLFVVFVFSSVTLLLITAIAQDIRFRGDSGFNPTAERRKSVTPASANGRV